MFWRTEMERAHPRWVADRGDETLRLDYPLDARSLVLDVGGYEGRWAERVIERFGCTVHVFEPVPAYAAAIEARLGGRARVHRFGLAAATGDVDFTLAADGSSALRRGGERLRVPMRAAAEVFEAMGFSDVSLMKVNIEGGEYDLLDHLLARGLVSRIAHLQVQFHDFVPRARARMRALQARLAATHRLAWQYPFVWESWSRVARAPEVAAHDAPRAHGAGSRAANGGIA